MATGETVITLPLTDKQALALAQFITRLTWTAFRGNTASEEEAYTLRAAIGLLRQALQDAGYMVR